MACDPNHRLERVTEITFDWHNTENPRPKSLAPHTLSGASYDIREPQWLVSSFGCGGGPSTNHPATYDTA